MTSLPQNLAAEEAVLGAMMITPSYIPKVAARLREEDFYLDTQRAVYRAIMEMHTSGEVIEPLTVTNRLGDSQKVYIHYLVSTTPAASNVSVYAEMVAEASAKREWMSLGRQLVENPGDLSTIERRFIEVKERTRPAALSVALTDALKEVLHYSQVDTPLPPGMDYPWQKITWLSGGLRPGWLCYLAGDTSYGKTAAALEMAEYSAKAGKKVLINTLEMSPVELGIRLSQRQGLDTRRYFQGKANDSDRMAIEVCQGLPEHANIEICRVAEMGRLTSTVDLIRPDLLILDYLQLMDVGNSRTREEGTRRNSNALKLLAGDRQIGVLCLAQFKRGETGRIPTKHDLKDSGATEQDADQVILIHRPLDEFKKPKDKGAFILDKARMGRIGKEDFTFDGERQKFICEESRYEQPDHKRAASGERQQTTF